jgi:hypothetical protein
MYTSVLLPASLATAPEEVGKLLYVLAQLFGQAIVEKDPDAVYDVRKWTRLARALAIRAQIISVGELEMIWEWEDSLKATLH